jgi:hypothetical protein
MSLLETLLLDREKVHNKSIIHVINRKSEIKEYANVICIQ